MRSRAIGIFLAAVIPSLGGCSAGVLLGPFDPSTWIDAVQEDEPVTVAVTWPVAVDVETFRGNVVVTADPRLDAAVVTLRREAGYGPGKGKEGKASLDMIDASIEVVAAEASQILRVKVWTHDIKPWLQQGHVDLRVPSVAGLTVRTGGGDVTAIGIEGGVSIEAAGGDVIVMTNRPMRRPVTITNHSGDIDYRVRGESTGAFDCEAPGGEVDARVRYGQLVVHGGDDKRMRATLNGGGNPVSLRAMDGDIRIAVVHNPTHVGMTVVDP